MFCRSSLLLFLLVTATVCGSAQTSFRPLKIAVLDQSANGSKFTEHFALGLELNNFKLIDKDLARAAATGAKIENPFNLSLNEAKNLGTLIDCDFFLAIKSETLRRSSFQKEVYFESYVVLFLVSAHTGRLVAWTDEYFEANTPVVAENILLAETKKIAAEFAAKINQTSERERLERNNLANVQANAVLIEGLPDETAIAEQNFRVPLPYKRLRPAYTEAAGRRIIVATVDVAAELDEQGAVMRAEIVRWAGYNLDEAAADAVRKMQFRPALRDGKPLAIRILLRYNFRDLQKQ